MSDEAQYSSGADSNKRKYDDQTAPPPSTRRPTGFSAPIAPHSPDSAPPSYNAVAPPIEGLIKAKQRAQEVAARLLISSAGAAAAAVGGGLDAKRPKFENGASGFDSHDSGFSSIPPGSFSLSSVLNLLGFSIYIELIRVEFLFSFLSYMCENFVYWFCW